MMMSLVAVRVEPQPAVASALSYQQALPAPSRGVSQAFARTLESGRGGHLKS